MVPRITRRGDDHAPAFPESFLARLYSLPRPLVTMEDFLRFHHQDLTDFSDEELARESRRVRSRADLDPEPASRAWLASRLAAIAEERASRRPRAARTLERPAPTTTDAPRRPVAESSRPPLSIAEQGEPPPRRRVAEVRRRRVITLTRKDACGAR